MLKIEERKSVFVSARVKRVERESLQAIADKEDRKISEIIRRAIDVYLESLDAEKN